ncbi:response regulator [Winogradskyella ursingii]|uniref:response regulator n=1 Tax=Winogradskyella ursingii TaxID=2686079 RepID=UPI0015CBF3BB|nr:response regulator [Winogradskyella ursingii]
MRFPKSSIFLLIVYFIFNCNYSFGQGELLVVNNTTKTCSFDSELLDRLVESDSLYKATTLLNEAIDFSNKYNLKAVEAKAYFRLGEVLTKLSNYKNAETKHLKALELYNLLNDNQGKNRVFSGLTDNYLKSKNYKKFDSLYPRAQNLAKALNSELYFVNLENNIKKNYYRHLNNNLLKLTTHAIDTLKLVDFNQLNLSKPYDVKHLKNRLLQSYRYHKAIAEIKLSNFRPKGFHLLFSISEEELKLAIKGDHEKNRKLATFNYYKFLYYNEVLKNVDSANKYLLASDVYKYNALLEYDNRSSRNGELITKIVNTEQKLNIANIMRIKDAKASQILMVTTIIISILLIVTLIFLYAHFKAKENIESINKELKESNEKLLAIDKDRLEFFSILSHELRTPIYGITGLATLIDQEKDEQKRQSYLDSLMSSSNYLSILIDNILQANKLKFEEKSLRLKPDKINRIVNHVISTVKVAAKNKGLQLITNIEESDDNEYILIDKIAFSQILINLVYNAIRYTREGHVSINIFEKSRTLEDVTLRFEVNDTGIGIKKEHRSVVFKAFENKTFLHKNSSGSGLGLNIVKTLLKSYGSDIDFTSVPNKGSSFFFEITFDLAISPNLNHPISIAPTKKDMHILIVDDNKINLLITKKNIEKIADFTCETVSNGRQAISIVKERVFDLVLMDINMPDMDGYEVTKHIRMFNLNIPILALTALNSAEISQKASEAGINQIITKPYIFEDFKHIILTYAEQQRFYRQIDLAAI